MSTKWTTADFTGQNDGKLKLTYSEPATLIAYSLLHVPSINQYESSLPGPQFIACVRQLQLLGWPIEAKAGPLRAEWHESVPDDVVAAWRDAWGQRFVGELANGTFMKDGIRTPNFADRYAR